MRTTYLACLMATLASSLKMQDLDDFITISSIPPEYRSSAVLDALPFKAAAIDQRAAYCMYVPTAAFNAANQTNTFLPLVVNVHGTSRRAEHCRDTLREFADDLGVAVLAPLFPFGIGDPNDADNYKEILYQDIRYDEILLGMLEEVKVRWEGTIEIEKFYLTGFSGGGQFVHRFLYLHPNRLKAASIGAPGTVTHLNESAWPLGIGDAAEIFNTRVDVEKIRDVKLHMVVGELDTSIAGEGISDVLGRQAGVKGRLETLKELHEEWSDLGIDARLDVMPGVAHDDKCVFPAVESFLRRVVPKVEMGDVCAN